MTSGIPPTFVATTGLPHQSASATNIPYVSPLDGITVIAVCVKYVAISICDKEPRKLIASLIGIPNSENHSQFHQQSSNG